MKRLFYILSLFTTLTYTACSEDSGASVNMNEVNSSVKTLKSDIYCDSYKIDVVAFATLGLVESENGIRVYMCCGAPFASPGAPPPSNTCKVVSKKTYEFWSKLSNQESKVIGTPIEEIIVNPNPVVDLRDIHTVEVIRSEVVNNTIIKKGSYPVVDGIVYLEIEEVK